MTLDLKGWTIVYDLDGTLVESAPDLHAALTHTLANLNLGPVPLDEIRNFIGDGAKALIQRGLAYHQHEVDEAQLVEHLWPNFLDYYAEHAADLSHPFEGVIEALEQFRSAGAKQAVCTNKAHNLARLVLEGLHLNNYFSVVTGGDTYNYRKPDGQHILSTLQHIDANPSRAIMVGDAYTDERAARDAELPFVFVQFGYGRLTLPPRSEDRMITHWREMQHAIESIID